MRLLLNLQEITVSKFMKGMILAVILTASIFIVVNLLDLKETSTYFTVGNKNPDNPDRGFYIQLDSKDKHRIEKYKDDVRLVLLAYDIYEYRDREISEEKLRELEAFLEETKKQNTKCIFRGSYGFERYESNDADNFNCITQHIQQIAPILNRYKEQIYCVQAGFLGPWGEWHSSKYLDEESGKENRNLLLQELLEQLDEDIVINVRRPRFIRDAIEAGLDGERIGYHNDGMFGSDTDLGTYDDSAYTREGEMQWLDENLGTGLNGGEMPYVNEFSKANMVINEMPKMKLSYLNLKYNEEVYADWKKDTIHGVNAFDYISGHLGYRFSVSQITYPVSFDKSLFFYFKNIRLVLENEGFAPIGNAYELEWVVKDESGNLHYFKSEQVLSEIESRESVEIQIPLRCFDGIQADGIGIRISSKYDTDKKPENCVELVNEQIIYEDGVNFLISKIERKNDI